MDKSKTLDWDLRDDQLAYLGEESPQWLIEIYEKS